MPGNADAVSSVRDLRFRYGPSFGFEVASLDIRAGEPVAIVGPSGCGKTTLLRLLTGVLLPESGSVRLLGREVSRCDASERRRIRLTSVGMVFQSFALMPYLSARENILLPYRLTAELRRTPEADDRAAALAESLGVAHTLGRKPGGLSQGERQRIAICRALVTRPRLVVCDEPTGNLDPSRSAETLDLILREADAIDAAVVVVTHDHTLLPGFDRVLDMTGLAVAETGSAAPSGGTR